MKRLKSAILAIILIAALILGTYISVQWYKTVHGWKVDADREVFKQSTTYNEAAASFLADAYKDYNDAETDKDRETIMQYVVMRYPNLDYSKIENRTLRNFYIDCVER